MATQTKALRRELVEHAAQFNHEMARMYALKLAGNLDELGETEPFRCTQSAVASLDDAKAASEVIVDG